VAEAIPRDERFPKSLRLRTRSQFLRVQEQGRKLTAGPLLALALHNGTSTTRIGFTVSTRVGGAVVRTRIRRRLRELFRKRRDQLPAGIDVVVIARASAAESDYEALARAFDSIARKLRETFP
jgi:ribonuclease P protein component